MSRSDRFTKLDHFLIFGSADRTYHVVPRAFDKAPVLAALEEDGVRTVRRVLELAETGRAPRDAPAIYTLAAAAKLGSAAAKKAAFAAMPRLCRTAAHLFAFARDLERFGGWGRATRRAIGRWYTRIPATPLAYQTVRFPSRDGWSHRDLLRLAHPQTTDPEQRAIFAHLAGIGRDLGTEAPAGATRILWARERVQRATSAREVAALIREHRLPEESVPAVWLDDVLVWEALLEDMSLPALLRNLRSLTRIGLARPFGAHAAAIASRLADRDALRKARLQPMAILFALAAYKLARPAPVPELLNALDAAFYAAFDNVEASGKQLVFALDVSSSMRCGKLAAATPAPGMTPMLASTAMSLVAAGTEKRATFLAFTADGWSNGQGGVGGVREVELGSRMRLGAAYDRVARLPFGGTDCALPMAWARAQRVDADTFVVLTDDEAWTGGAPAQRALAEYRAARGRDAKLVVVGMSSTGFQVADPADAGMLDVVGFDATVSPLLADFARQNSGTRDSSNSLEN